MRLKKSNLLSNLCFLIIFIFVCYVLFCNFLVYKEFYEKDDIKNLIDSSISLIFTFIILFELAFSYFLNYILEQLSRLYSSQKRLFYHLESSYTFFDKKSKYGEPRSKFDKV